MVLPLQLVNMYSNYLATRVKSLSVCIPVHVHIFKTVMPLHHVEPVQIHHSAARSHPQHQQVYNAIQVNHTEGCNHSSTR